MMIFFGKAVKINRINYLNILILLIFLMVFQSTDVLAIAKRNPDVQFHEDSIRYYFELLAHESDDKNKISFNDRILDCFRDALKNEDSFTYPFDSLKNIGIISSEDEKLRILTWNLPFNDRTHKYFGFIQYKRSKRSYVFYELNDNSEMIKNPEFEILNDKNWYGALYYKIITNKYKGNVYYTLLGADLNNLLTKKKIIDILYFNKDQSLYFGNKVFKNRNTPVSRLIFEYSSQINMTLTYDEKKQMIVYDHLSPSRPSLEGEYEYYGPDFSYDALKFERGIWNTYSDVDIRDDSIK